MTTALTGVPISWTRPAANTPVLNVIAHDPESTARTDNCTVMAEDGSEIPAFFGVTPECWNYADFRRRVWGLETYTDPVSEETRLYYAVWGGKAYGNPDWETASTDAKTTIWSVQLAEDGSFDVTDVRREFVMPDFAPLGEEALQPETSPVADIAFSCDCVMFLAERGAPNPTPDALIEPKQGRVLRYIRNDEGVWNWTGATTPVSTSERMRAHPSSAQLRAAVLHSAMATAKKACSTRTHLRRRCG